MKKCTQCKKIKDLSEFTDDNKFFVLLNWHRDTFDDPHMKKFIDHLCNVVDRAFVGIIVDRTRFALFCSFHLMESLNFLLNIYKNMYVYL